ncbi:MAG: putative Ig domain-containing protein [Bacteroidota bacterium]
MINFLQLNKNFISKLLLMFLFLGTQSAFGQEIPNKYGGQVLSVAGVKSGNYIGSLEKDSHYQLIVSYDLANFDDVDWANSYFAFSVIVNKNGNTSTGKDVDLVGIDANYSNYYWHGYTDEEQIALFTAGATTIAEDIITKANAANGTTEVEVKTEANTALKDYLKARHDDYVLDNSKRYIYLKLVNPLGQEPSASGYDYYYINLKGYDGDKTSLITISGDAPANNAPEFGTIAATESINAGTALSIDISATDADGDDLTYSVAMTDESALPAFISVSGTNLVVGTDATAGTYAVTVTVSDGTDNDSEDIIITVTDPSANVAPVFTATGNKSAAVGIAKTIALTASDENGDALTYSITSGAESFITIPNASVAELAVSDQSVAGTYTVTVEVSDGRGGTDTDTFDIEIVNPVYSPADGSQFTTDDVVAFDWYLDAPSTETHSLYVESIDENGVKIEEVLVVRGIPDGQNHNEGQAFAVGSYKWYGKAYSAADGVTNAGPFFFTVTDANATNTAPELGIIGNITDVVAGTEYTKVLSATDADNDQLTFSIVATNGTDDITGITISETDLVVASSVAAGTYAVTVTVSDGTDSDSEDIIITVTAPNKTPVLGSIGDQTATEGIAKSVAISASDADSDDLIFSISGEPAGVTLVVDNNDNTKASIEISAAVVVGTHSDIIVTVSDGTDSASETISIVVEGNNLSNGELSLSEFSIYPNPVVGGVLNINLPKSEQDISLSIYNINGRLVYNTVVDKESLKFTGNVNLDKGLYLVRITSFKFDFTKKLIIE